MKGRCSGFFHDLMTANVPSSDICSSGLLVLHPFGFRCPVASADSGHGSCELIAGPSLQRDGPQEERDEDEHRDSENLPQKMEVPE